jgi:hypothetical protein
MQAYQVKLRLETKNHEYYFTDKELAETFAENFKRVIISGDMTDFEFTYNIIKIFENEEEINNEFLDAINIISQRRRN